MLSNGLWVHIFIDICKNKNIWDIYWFMKCNQGGGVDGFKPPLDIGWYRPHIFIDIIGCKSAY